MRICFALFNLFILHYFAWIRIIAAIDVVSLDVIVVFCSIKGSRNKTGNNRRRRSRAIVEDRGNSNKNSIARKITVCIHLFWLHVVKWIDCVTYAFRLGPTTDAGLTLRLTDDWRSTSTDHSLLRAVKWYLNRAIVTRIYNIIKHKLWQELIEECQIGYKILIAPSIADEEKAEWSGVDLLFDEMFKWFVYQLMDFSGWSGDLDETSWRSR